jgi:hypothetical protein
MVPMIAANTAQLTPYQNNPCAPHTATSAATIVAFRASLATPMSPSEPKTRGLLLSVFVSTILYDHLSIAENQQSTIEPIW